MSYTARTPRELHSVFLEAFNSRDIDGLMSLYEPDAVLIPQPGSVAAGLGQIRESLQGLLALNGPVELVTREEILAGDVAYLSGRWTLTGTGPDGNALTIGGVSIEIARRQSDGSWRFVFDNPIADQTLLAG